MKTILLAFDIPFSETWAFGSMVFGGISAVVTIFLWNLAKGHFKHERTALYVERYTSAEFTRLRAEVDQFLYLTEKLVPGDRGAVYKELLFSDHLEDMEFRHKLWTFTMLYNEIGLAWQSRVIDTEVIANFDRLIPRYWMRLRPYIMNLHLRFGFEVPVDEHGFKSEFKLFKGFRFAYVKICDSSFAILPQDLETSSLLCRENYTALEHAMIHSRPDKPCRLGAGNSVIEEVRASGRVQSGH